MTLRCVPLILLLLGLTSQAGAQVDLSGAWRASGLRIRYQVTEWGPDCGPRPPAQTSESGGGVQVTQRGDDLSFSGAVRWTTNTCASETPGLNRVSSSFQGGSWTTRCQTPNGHAHPERGVYRLASRDDGSLRYTETTHWNWALRASTCVATRTATRSFTRPESAAPTPEPTMTEVPEPETHCTPGAAARLSLRPTQANVEPGARQCFRAAVVDSAGCPVPGRSVSLALVGSSERGGIEGRCFVAANDAAEAEGTVEIVATSQGLRASARVRIAPTDLTGLRAQGGAGRRLEAAGEAEAHGASGVSARVGSDGTPWIWIGAAIALVSLFLLVAVVLVLRRGRASPSAQVLAAAIPEADGLLETEDPLEPEVPEPPAAPVASGDNLICPACRRGYPAGSRFCPNDSEALITYAEYRTRTNPPAEGPTCPTCGTRYPAGTTFCGKDGTPL